MTKKDLSGCSFCRFMRALSFSSVGAAVVGLTARELGADMQTIMIAAFFGALGLVCWVNRKRDK